MAELLGTISAIVGLVEFSGSVLSLGYGYISKVVRAPKEVRSLLGEVAALDAILDKLRDAVDDTTDKPGMERTLESLSKLGVLDAYSSLLKEAEECIQACSRLHGRSTYSGKNIGRRLLWPFKEGETKHLLDRLRDVRDTLTAALTVDSAAALRRIETSQTKLQSDLSILSRAAEAEQETRQHDQLMKWVCPEDIKPDEDLEAALQSRKANTCNWLFSSDKFRSWSATETSLFWLYGIAGSGKTVLTSATIEHLKSDQIRGTDGALAYFYCQHNDPRKQTSRHLLMTIAAQLIAMSTDCLMDVAALFQSKTSEGEDTLTEVDYHTLIQSMLGHFARFFIIIDALDESEEAEQIVKSLEKLLSFKQQQCGVRVLVTSRNSVQMEHLILPFASFKLALHDHTREDILSYVTDEVKSRLSKRPPRIQDLEPLVVEEILVHTKGLFLQAKLQIDYLCAFKTPGEIKRALKAIPSGLDPIYDKMLAQIVSRQSQSLGLLKRVLSWVLGSVVPLPLESLAHAVAVRLADNTIDEDNIADAEDLAEMAGSFISIEQNFRGDRVVALAHYSVVEFFGSEHLAASPQGSFFIVSKDLHFRLGLICLKYLSLRELEQYVPKSGDSSQDFSALHKNYPFYRYAATWWMTHLKRSRVSQDEFSKRVFPYLQWFLAPKPAGQDQYHLWQCVASSARHVNPPVGKDKHLTFGDGGWQPPISYAIGFGLKQVFNVLVSNVSGPNAKFSNGHTLLSWAVLTGRYNITDRLLELNADPDEPCDKVWQKGMTPLHVAAETGNFEIAALLLKHGAQPDKRSTSGATAFYRAVRSGSISIMKLLKDAGADINVRTWDYWTPVFEATLLHRVSALKLLLEWGADANVPTSTGQTPWSVAAKASSLSELKDLLRPHISQATKLRPPAPASADDEATKFVECCSCGASNNAKTFIVCKCGHKLCNSCTWRDDRNKKA